MSKKMNLEETIVQAKERGCPQLASRASAAEARMNFFMICLGKKGLTESHLTFYLKSFWANWVR